MITILLLGTFVAIVALVVHLIVRRYWVASVVSGVVTTVLLGLLIRSNGLTGARQGLIAVALLVACILVPAVAGLPLAIRRRRRAARVPGFAPILSGRGGSPD